VTTSNTERRSAPQRTCIGCRTTMAPDMMVRCAFTSSGPVVGRAEPGRGAWLCSIECFDRAAQRRAFRKAWRAEVDLDELAALRTAFEAVVTQMRE
jgi:uncharacterized protein